MHKWASVHGLVCEESNAERAATITWASTCTQHQYAAEERELNQNTDKGPNNSWQNSSTNTSG